MCVYCPGGKSWIWYWRSPAKYTCTPAKHHHHHTNWLPGSMTPTWLRPLRTCWEASMGLGMAPMEKHMLGLWRSTCPCIMDIMYVNAPCMVQYTHYMCIYVTNMYAGSYRWTATSTTPPEERYGQPLGNKAQKNVNPCICVCQARSPARFGLPASSMLSLIETQSPKTYVLHHILQHVYILYPYTAI